MKKILFDAQSLQTDSATRGIGRYISGLIIALSKQVGYEVSVLLNGLLPSPLNLHEIQKYGVVVHYFYPPSVVQSSDLGRMHYEQAELFYERAVKCIKPDFLLIGCLTECGQNFVTPPTERIKKYCTVATVVYDLIPLENIDHYLPLAPLKACYKMSLIRIASSDLLLCISDYVKKHVGILFPDVRCQTIWGGVNFPFTDVVYSFEKRENYILYAGGVDPRKNVLQLIRAFALLPKRLQNKYPLKVLCSNNIQIYNRFQAEAQNLGISENIDILLKIDDQGLADLYRKCRLFIFPSLSEGLGLPVLEAMATGAAVLTSRGTSLKEIYPKEEALFDPHSPENLAVHIQSFIDDDEKIKNLQQFSLQRAPIFTWESVACRCVKAMEEHYVQREKPKIMTQEEFITQLSFYIGNDETALRQCAKALARLYGEASESN